MIIETLTIFYYSIASLSIGLVLCNTYNIQITRFINKWLYNYEPLNSDDNNENENDLGLYKQLSNSDDSYILFNNEINNNGINNNGINNNLNIKTKKNVIIDFE